MTMILMIMNGFLKAEQELLHLQNNSDMVENSNVNAIDYLHNSRLLFVSLAW